MPTAMGKWQDSESISRKARSLHSVRLLSRKEEEKDWRLHCTSSWLSMSAGDEISNRRHGWFIMTIIRADKQAVHEKEGGDQGVKENGRGKRGRGGKKK